MAKKEEYQADSSDDDAIISEIRERLQLCIDAEQRNRADALHDLKFLSGEQWPEDAKRLRTLERRPCLTINKLPTFLHQVTNDQRQNRPSMKIHPVDDNSDPETAKVIQGMIRHIEYSSNADICYDTAVSSAAAIGFGYFRLITDYVREDSFDQEIRFQRIRNPFTVYLDPAAQEHDGSDMNFAIITNELSKDEFTRMYPDAEASQFLERGTGDVGRNWISDEMVRVAEYYRVERKPGKLIRLSNGEEGWKDELIEMPEGVYVVKERDATKKSVAWYKCTGVDILERAEIPCEWIPVFPVYGDEIDIEGKIIRSGMIRHAKDPAQAYNFWFTCATEEISLRPKSPFIGAEGQFEGHENEWAQANVRSFPYLEYKPTTVDGQLAPQPSRQPMADIPSGMLQMAMHAADNIKATTNVFDASLGAKGNETSGKAIQARQRQGDVGNFHYIDNLNRTIRHTGRCILSMIPKIYDTERVVRILGEDDSVEHATVNQPMAQPKVDEKTGAIQTMLNDLSVGKYDVVVSSGPSYSTLRQEAADAMIQFGQSWPKLMDIAGDKVVKAMDWPGAEEIAERILKTIPAELLDDKDSENAPQIPPEVQQQMQQSEQTIKQMQEYIQEIEASLKESKSSVEKEHIKAASAEKIALINADSRSDVEELKGWIAMMLAKMMPPPALTAEAFEPDADDQGGTEQTEYAPEQAPAQEYAQQGMQTAPNGYVGQ